MRDTRDARDKDTSQHVGVEPRSQCELVPRSCDDVQQRAGEERKQTRIYSFCRERELAKASQGLVLAGASPPGAPESASCEAVRIVLLQLLQFPGCNGSG